MAEQITISAELARWVIDQQRRMTAILEEEQRADWFEADDIARRIADELAVEFERALETPSELDPRGLLDPKGNVVLMEFEGGGGRADAFVFRGGECSPFVYAFDYDRETGEWSQGRYFSDPCRAYFAANPKIVEGSAIWWEREDFARALEEAGIAPSDFDIDVLIDRCRDMKGWLDRAIEDGNEMIGDEALCLAEETSEA